MTTSSLDRATAAIVRAALDTSAWPAQTLADELERGDIDGWMDIVVSHRLTFSQWSGCMERAIARIGA